jgi:hypothetical protein
VILLVHVEHPFGNFFPKPKSGYSGADRGICSACAAGLCISTVRARAGPPGAGIIACGWRAIHWKSRSVREKKHHDNIRDMIAAASHVLSSSKQRRKFSLTRFLLRERKSIVSPPRRVDINLHAGPS